MMEWIYRRRYKCWSILNLPIVLLNTILVLSVSQLTHNSPDCWATAPILIHREDKRSWFGLRAEHWGRPLHSKRAASLRKAPSFVTLKVTWWSHSWAAVFHSKAAWIEAEGRIGEWKMWLMPTIHSIQLAHTGGAVCVCACICVCACVWVPACICVCVCTYPYSCLSAVLCVCSVEARQGQEE